MENLQRQPAQREGVPLAVGPLVLSCVREKVVGIWLVRRAQLLLMGVHRQLRPLLQQGGNGPHVVPVAVGQEDHFRLQTALFYHGKHPLRGPAGVHDGADLRLPVSDQIAVGVDLSNGDGIKNHGNTRSFPVKALFLFIFLRAGCADTGTGK